MEHLPFMEGTPNYDMQPMQLTQPLQPSQPSQPYRSHSTCSPHSPHTYWISSQALCSTVTSSPSLAWTSLELIQTRTRTRWEAFNKLNKHKGLRSSLVWIIKYFSTDVVFNLGKGTTNKQLGIKISNSVLTSVTYCTCELCAPNNLLVTILQRIFFKKDFVLMRQ